MVGSTLPRGRQLRIVSVAATGLLLASIAVASPGNAQTVSSAANEPAAAVEAPLGVDEIASSPNLKLIANLPKQAPFNTTARSAPTSPSRAGTPSSATTTASSSTTCPSRADRRSSRRCSARARRTTSPSTVTCSSCRRTRPATTTRAAAPPSPHDQGIVGGHQDLRHQSQGQPAVHQGGRDGLRLAHPHAGTGEGPEVGLPVRLLVQPEWRLPGLPAAARLDQHRQGAAEEADRRGRGRHAEPLPRRRLRGSHRRLGDLRLPRHHRLPVQGPRRRCLHG